MKIATFKKWDFTEMGYARRFLAVCALILLPNASLFGAARQPPEPTLKEAAECRPRSGLPNALARLKAGKEVRIAYLGGSITEQAGWRVKSLDWFRKQYPTAKISEINAAIGGTGSDLGVFRLHHDVLQFKPDLLFVEFAVNDSGAPPDRIHKSMEGIVRQTWRDNPMTDICFVYTLTEGMLGDLQNGRFPRAASAMEDVADHYGIPSIHMGLEVARLQKAGMVVFRGPLPKTDAERTALGDKIVFSGDGVHPYPETGHQLYLDSIMRSMAMIDGKGKAGRHSLPKPLDPANWEKAKMVPLTEVQLSGEWQKLDPAKNTLAKRFQNRIPDLWKVNKPGATMSFHFKGTTAMIYDLLGPDCGQVSLQLDQSAPKVHSRFDSFSNYHRLGTLVVADSLPDAVHTVTIKLLPEQPDKLAILHQRQENAGIKMLDPTTYNDIAWYAGAVLVLGDIVR